MAMTTLAASVHLASVETILAAGVFVVLMIGTFRGDRALVPLTWVAVGILALAGVHLAVVPPGRRGSAASMSATPSRPSSKC